VKCKSLTYKFFVFRSLLFPPLFAKNVKYILSLNDVTLYLSSNSVTMILRRDIFQAIADPTRRAILLLLASQTITAGAIAENFDNARSTVSKHIQILTECGLVESNQQGREIYYQINFERMAEIDLWMNQLRKIWENRFGNLEKYLAKIQKKSKK
jgi:DNA-binding transcriptional ArsR family regulator